MAVRAGAERGATERLQFLDAVRGFALLLMILNHTERWWQDNAMGWPRYNLIYVSMAVGAPLFLFLVGFCMPLSFARRRPTGSLASIAGKFLQRGARLVLASWLLNFLVFRDEPFWEGGVLQTIGLGIILALPPMLVMHRRGARTALLALAIGLYVLFSMSYAQVLAWAPRHPVLERVFLWEFAPWPWVSLVWAGLALGWTWALLDTPERRARYLKIMTAVGVAFLVALAIWDWQHGTPLHLSLSFKRDFVVNHHWIPRGVTNFLCLGSVFALIGLAYYLVEIKRLPAGWLVVLGRTSLVLYFVHHLIVLTLTNEGLGWKLDSWWTFAFANVVLTVVLVYLGKLWLEIKSVVGARLRPHRPSTVPS
jgi:uncharacterized membrane protein